MKALQYLIAYLAFCLIRLSRGGVFESDQLGFQLSWRTLVFENESSRVYHALKNLNSLYDFFDVAFSEEHRLLKEPLGESEASSDLLEKLHASNMSQLSALNERVELVSSRVERLVKGYNIISKGARFLSERFARSLGLDRRIAHCRDIVVDMQKKYVDLVNRADHYRGVLNTTNANLASGVKILSPQKYKDLMAAYSSGEVSLRMYVDLLKKYAASSSERESEMKDTLGGLARYMASERGFGSRAPVEALVLLSSYMNVSLVSMESLLVVFSGTSKILLQDHEKLSRIPDSCLEQLGEADVRKEDILNMKREAESSRALRSEELSAVIKELEESAASMGKTGKEISEVLKTLAVDELKYVVKNYLAFNQEQMLYYFDMFPYVIEDFSKQFSPLMHENLIALKKSLLESYRVYMHPFENRAFLPERLNNMISLFPFINRLAFLGEVWEEFESGETPFKREGRSFSELRRLYEDLSNLRESLSDPSYELQYLKRAYDAYRSGETGIDGISNLQQDFERFNKLLGTQSMSKTILTAYVKSMSRLDSYCNTFYDHKPQSTLEDLRRLATEYRESKSLPSLLSRLSEAFDFFERYTSDAMKLAEESGGAPSESFNLPPEVPESGESLAEPSGLSEKKKYYFDLLKTNKKLSVDHLMNAQKSLAESSTLFENSDIDKTKGGIELVLKMFVGLAHLFTMNSSSVSEIYEGKVLNLSRLVERMNFLPEDIQSVLASFYEGAIKYDERVFGGTKTVRKFVRSSRVLISMATALFYGMRVNYLDESPSSTIKYMKYVKLIDDQMPLVVRILIDTDVKNDLAATVFRFMFNLEVSVFCAMLVSRDFFNNSLMEKLMMYKQIKAHHLPEFDKTKKFSDRLGLGKSSNRDGLVSEESAAGSPGAGQSIDELDALKSHADSVLSMLNSGVDTPGEDSADTPDSESDSETTRDSSSSASQSTTNDSSGSDIPSTDSSGEY